MPYISSRTSSRSLILFIFSLLTFSSLFAQHPNICLEAGSTGCTITSPSPDSDYFESADCLCRHGVIINGKDGDTRPEEFIKRGQLSKVAYESLYRGRGRSVADKLPNPFLDLTDPETFYYAYAVTLSYLEYGDGIVPFNRNGYNFDPEGYIRRKYVLKVLLEAWNIPLEKVSEVDLTAPGWFSDVPYDSYKDDGLEYIYTAWKIGIIPKGGRFFPEDNCKRKDAFLWTANILSNTSIPKPSVAELNNLSNYFIPGNFNPVRSPMTPGAPQGNFSFFSKPVFMLQGVMPLAFGFSYNSYLTEMPDGFFPNKPLGVGWNHNYNFTAVATDDGRLIVFNPSSTVHVFDVSSGRSITPNVYSRVVERNGGEIYALIDKSQTTYIFKRLNSTDEYHVLIGIADRNKNTITLSYENNNPAKLERVEGPAGRKLLFRYGSGVTANKLIEVEDPQINRKVRFGHSDIGGDQLRTFVDAESNVTSFRYSLNCDAANYEPSRYHLLCEVLLPEGNTISNKYDDNNKLYESKSEDYSVSIDFGEAYSGSGDVGSYLNSTVTSSTGGQTQKLSYGFDSKGRPTKIRDLEYSGIDFGVTYTDGENPFLPKADTLNGIITEYRYDGNGNRTYVKRFKDGGKDGSITERYFYNSNNDLERYTDPRNKTYVFRYDDSGNLKEVIPPIAATGVSMDYNGNGTLARIVDGEGMEVVFEQYDPYGNPEVIATPILDIRSQATYDLAGRVKTTTDASGNLTAYSYDNNDNPELVGFKMMGNNIVHRYIYDKNQNIKSIVNGKGVPTSFTYDEFDRLKTVSFAGKTKSYTYLEDGRIDTYTSPSGKLFDYKYDEAKRLIDDGYATYDYHFYPDYMDIKSITRNGKSVGMTYDDFKRLKTVSYPRVGTVTYGYDQADNITSITYPDGKKVTYTFDDNGRLEKVRDWNSRETIYRYRNDNKIKEIELPNGSKRIYDYDNAGRIEGLRNIRTDGSVINAYSYVLDGVGNVLQSTKTEPYGAVEKRVFSQEYRYRSDNTIETVSDGVLIASQQYKWDRDGNLESQTGSLFPSWTTTFDKADNLLTVSGDFTAQYSYDGMGNRRSATRNGVTSQYTLDISGMSQVLVEKVGNKTYYYVYGMGLLYRAEANEGLRYYYYDLRGSTIAMTNSEGVNTHTYQYDAWGKVLQSNEESLNRFRYVGEQGVMWESEGLYFMRARYYSAFTGSFLSEDPVWNVNNLYGYAPAENPVVFMDPAGRSAISAITKLGKFILTKPKQVLKGVENFLNLKGGFEAIAETDLEEKFVKGGGFVAGLYIGTKLAVGAGTACAKPALVGGPYVAGTAFLVCSIPVAFGVDQAISDGFEYLYNTIKPGASFLYEKAIVANEWVTDEYYETKANIQEEFRNFDDKLIWGFTTWGGKYPVLYPDY